MQIKMSSREKVIHLLWTIGLMLAFGIWQFSTTWSSSEALIQTISLAVGITSFVVGVYAIFQGLISGNAITEVAAELRLSAGQLSTAADRVHSVTEQLNAKFDALPQRFDEVSERLEALSKAKELSQVIPTNDSKKNGKLPDTFKSGELISLYICALAILRNHNEVFIDKIGFNGSVAKDFTLGYITSLASWNIIDAEIGSDYGRLKINSMNDIDPNEILVLVSKNVEKGYIKSNKPAVDSYFYISTAQ